jgi:hypothetical protein
MLSREALARRVTGFAAGTRSGCGRLLFVASARRRGRTKQALDGRALVRAELHGVWMPAMAPWREGLRLVNG